MNCKDCIHGHVCKFTREVSELGDHIDELNKRQAEQGSPISVYAQCCAEEIAIREEIGKCLSTTIPAVNSGWCR